MTMLTEPLFSYYSGSLTKITDFYFPINSPTRIQFYVEAHYTGGYGSPERPNGL